MSTRDEREKNTDMNKRHTATLNKLMALPENATCVDCTERGRPSWASWNLGVFLCIQCSGIHRRLGVHISKVRSVTLDRWQPDWIKSMEKGGNKKCNAEWEHHLPPGFKKLNSNSPAIEVYIRDKYEKKLWKRSSPAPSNPGAIVANYKRIQDEAASAGPSEMSYMSQSSSSYQGSGGGGGGGSGYKSSGNMQGFGSNGQAHKMSNGDDLMANAMASLTTGWSAFAKSASEVAAVAAERAVELGETINDKVIAPTKEAIADGELLTRVQQKLKTVVSSSKRGGRGGGGGGGDDFFSSMGLEEQEGYSRDDVNRSVSNKDSFFSGKMSENANRPADLPPSQGGKYAGFGSGGGGSGGGGGGGPSKADYDRSAANKGSFFSGLMSENASRPADLPPSQGGKYAGFGSGSGGGGGGPSKADYDRSAANTGSFFSGLMSENASRPADLPPSQGGKYAGFGSGGARTTQQSADATSSKSSKSQEGGGWGDDWGDDSASSKPANSQTKAAPSKPKAKAKSKPAKKADGWDDDGGWGDDW